jgi:hypothetical protein
VFLEVTMTKEQKGECEDLELLRDILKRVLEDQKFMLNVRYVAVGNSLGNTITIINGRGFKIICSQCGH